jgi:HK97 family phage major capsid protein
LRSGVVRTPLSTRDKTKNRKEKTKMNHKKADNATSLVKYMAEASVLSKRNRTKQESSRLVYLTQAISLLKSGAVNAEELREAEVNESLVKAGELPVHFRESVLDEKRSAAARVWQAFARGEERSVEVRDQQTGSVSISYSNTSGATLVPTDFFSALPMAMATHSPLFDEDSVTFLKTNNARPMLVPFASDIENVATAVSENTSLTEADIAQLSSKTLGGFAYKSPLWKTSIEFGQDASEAFNLTQLFERFAADRVARGAGADLLLNSSANKPYGLIPSLLALGATVTAQGSSSNTGGSETGANSIGSADVSKLFFAVPAPYRNSDKCYWLMNDSTAMYLSTLVSKMGTPILDLNAPVLNLMGRPVKIDNNMPSIGASQTPLAFGNFGFWATRYAVDSGYIKVFRERFAEKGQLAWAAYVRVDGCLMFSDTGSPSPIALLQNHS